MVVAIITNSTPIARQIGKVNWICAISRISRNMSFPIRNSINFVSHAITIEQKMIIEISVAIHETTSFKVSSFAMKIPYCLRFNKAFVVNTAIMELIAIADKNTARPICRLVNTAVSSLYSLYSSFSVTADASNPCCKE